VLLVVLDEINALDEETVSLLSRMAQNLSFGLDNIDREEACKRNERRRATIGQDVCSAQRHQ
jgi:hypothetical protein